MKNNGKQTKGKQFHYQYITEGSGVKKLTDFIAQFKQKPVIGVTYRLGGQHFVVNSIVGGVVFVTHKPRTILINNWHNKRKQWLQE